MICIFDFRTTVGWIAKLNQAAQFLLLRWTVTALKSILTSFLMSHWKILLMSWLILKNPKNGGERRDSSCFWAIISFLWGKTSLHICSSSFTLTLTFSTKYLIQDINNLTMFAIYDLFVQFVTQLWENWLKALWTHSSLCRSLQFVFQGSTLIFSDNSPLLNKFATRPFKSFVCACSQINSDFQLEDWWINFTVLCLFHWRLFKEPIMHWELC